ANHRAPATPAAEQASKGVVVALLLGAGGAPLAHPTLGRVKRRAVDERWVRRGHDDAQAAIEAGVDRVAKNGADGARRPLASESRLDTVTVELGGDAAEAFAFL